MWRSVDSQSSPLIGLVFKLFTTFVAEFKKNKYRYQVLPLYFTLISCCQISTGTYGTGTGSIAMYDTYLEQSLIPLAVQSLMIPPILNPPAWMKWVSAPIVDMSIPLLKVAILILGSRCSCTRGNEERQGQTGCHRLKPPYSLKMVVAYKLGVKLMHFRTQVRYGTGTYSFYQSCGSFYLSSSRSVMTWPVGSGSVSVKTLPGSNPNIIIRSMPLRRKIHWYRYLLKTIYKMMDLDLKWPVSLDPNPNSDT